MKKKHSRAAAGLSKSAKKFASVIGRFSQDGVTVYAAQATFYIIVASIPFLMILVSLSRHIFPEAINALFSALQEILPKRFGDLIEGVYNELFAASDVSIVSITVLMALWSSSRAIASVIRGVSFIYDAKHNPGILRGILYSLLYTVAFVILIISVLIILVFGVTLKNLLASEFTSLKWLFDLIINFRGVLFFVILTLFFSLIYYAVSKGIVKASGSLRKYSAQLPGAVFATAGWMLFSYCFSIYVNHFPSASYIYGSLAAVMLMMLWLYFCMVILLAGAELNKLLSK